MKDTARSSQPRLPLLCCSTAALLLPRAPGCQPALGCSNTEIKVVVGLVLFFFTIFVTILTYAGHTSLYEFNNKVEIFPCKFNASLLF